MQTCESCGTQFESSGDVQEVTSLRILCAKCAAERAAAKARKAQAVTGAAARPAPSASARPAQPANARLAPSAAARPATPPPRPAAPEVPAQRVVERSSKPAPLAAPAPAASASRRAAPAPDAAKPAGPKALAARKKKKPEIELASRDLKKKGAREMIIAYVVVFVVCGVAGLVLWRVMGTKNAEKAARDAALAKVESFRTTFLGMNFDTEDGAKALIAYADENKPTWLQEDFAQDVVSRTAKAKTFLETEEKRRGLRQRFDSIKAVMAKAAELPPNELAEARRQLEELAGQANLMGADFVAEVAKAREDIEHIYIERLQSAAQAAAATEPLDRAALTTIQQSEDELFKVFNTAALAWNKDRQNPALTERKQELEGKYKEMIKLSDDAVARFFTPAVIEGVEWRDLLSEGQKGEWKGAATLKGYKNDGGEMHLVGLDPDADGQSMISIGDNAVWRDFAVDIEFTIVKGSFELFFRMPLQYQENIQTVDLHTDEGGLEVGRAYTYSFLALGSSLLEEQIGEDSLGKTDLTIPWTYVRKGAFAISIPKEAEVRITRLRAKVLRPAQ